MANQLFKPEGGSLIRAKHAGRGELDQVKPFQKDIFLFETYVAGTSHVEGIEDLEPYINPGDRLELFRDEENNYDHMAIEIKNQDGMKLGYVPRKDNVVFSRLMDAGKMLYCKVKKTSYKGSWLKINIEIYLHEI